MFNASKTLEVALARITNLHLVTPGTFLIWFNLSDPPTYEDDLLTVGENSAWCLAVVRFCTLILVNAGISFQKANLSRL
jgi:hypothetical protein